MVSIENLEVRVSRLENDNHALYVLFDDHVREFNEFRDETRHAFEVVNGRLDGIETRLDNLETRLDNLETRLDNLEARLDNLETQVQTIATTLAEILRRLPARD